MWKWIPGFEGRYCVNEIGQIYSNVKHKMLKPTIDRYGYQKVVLTKDGKPHYRTVHRLVAQAFIPNPAGKNTVNHINENKLDNRVENLEWLTVRENDNHGTRNQRMMLTKSKKPVIREVNGNQECFLGVKDASRKTGIAHSQISRFCKDPVNKEWRYL